MYEHFRDSFAVKLYEKHFDKDSVEKILSALDDSSVGYEIKKNDALATIDTASYDLIKTFLVCKKTEGLSDKTLRNYYYTLKNFFDNVKKNPNDVKANDIRAYLFTYQRERRCSDRSLDKFRQYLNLFFVWACSEEYIEKNPALTVKPIRFETKPRKSMTQMELEYIRKSAKTEKEKAIVEVLYSTGCRVAELCGLEVGDVDLMSGTVHLFGKGKKHRESYLNAKAVVALNAYMKTRSDENNYVFQYDNCHRKMSERAVEDVIRKIADDAGVEGVTPHVFRHTCATQALRSGMEITTIQKLLGHSNISTTMIYAETDQSTVRSNHRKFVV